MRCFSSPGTCAHVFIELHLQAPIAHTDGTSKRRPAHFAIAYSSSPHEVFDCLRWRRNPKSKVKVRSSLSSIGYTRKHPVSPTTILAHNPCWVQEELTVRSLQEEDIVEIGGFGTVEGKTRRFDEYSCVDGDIANMANQENEFKEVGTQEEDVNDDSTHILYIAQEEVRTQEGDINNGTHMLYIAQEEVGTQEEDGDDGTHMLYITQEEVRTQEDDVNNGTHMLYIAQEEEGTQQEDISDVTHNVQNDVVIFVDLMRSCVEQHDLHRGSRVHADLIKTGLLEKNVVIGNTLVNMYAKCGALQKAQEVFEILPAWSLVSWNVLLAGYTQHGDNAKAVYYFERMQCEGFYPNEVTFTCILKACGSIGDSDIGQAVHALMVRDGLLDINVHVGTALLDMYAKCGLLQKAQEIFDSLPVRNIVSWTALIVGYIQYEHGEEALRCFEQMQLEGFVPDAFTFSCALKACCSIGALVEGQEIHALIIKECLFEKNIVVASALVDMYAKFGALDRAHCVFDTLPFRDRISWTALITGYALHGHGEKALICSKQMQRDGFSPNEVTFAGILKACCSIGASETGQRIHAEIVREGLLGKDIQLGTALVDMYVKCGLIAKAEDIFYQLRVRDVATWTALITAYVQNEQFEDALFYFEQMQFEGIFPDAVTFSCILTACGCVAAANKGQKVHIKVIKLGLIEEDMVVGTALVDMYVNCGMIVEAQDVFDKLQVRDVVSWSTLMVGYAQLGKDATVFKILDDMIEEGEEPTVATFTIVLNTCSHRGLLYEGQHYFEMLSKEYGIIPNLEQHTCMVDLFGRAGNLDKAVAMIMEMSIIANLTLWTTLLSACLRWGNIKLGRWAFDHAVQVDEMDGAAYICMNNIYAAAGRHEDAHKIEAMRIEKQAWSLNEGGAFLVV